MKNFLLFTLMLISVSLIAQAELVADINEGSDDSGIYYSFGFNDNNVLSLGSKIIFIAESNTFGRELFVLENGMVDLLKDIKIDGSASPVGLVEFQEKIYFSALDSTGHRIWRTDGTNEGTEVAFDLESAPFSGQYQIFLKNETELFFVFDGTAYVFDGIELKTVDYDSEISLYSSSGFNSRGWCTYKEGFSIMNYNGSSWDLLYIHNDVVENLMNFVANDSFKGPYAMAAFEGGISFSFEASFDDDIEGRYLYLDDSNTYTKQANFTGRIISVNDTSCVIYGDSEFILHDKNNPTGTKLLNGTLSLTQGENWNRVIVGNRLVFASSEGVFEDAIITLLNTSDGSHKNIYTGDDLTRMYSYDKYIIFFAESENSIFDEGLFCYDLVTEELNQIAEIKDAPFNTEFYPLGVIGEYLYFFGNLDNEFGVEVYRIQVDKPTSTSEIVELDNLKFTQKTANSFQLKTDLAGTFTVEIYTNDGRLIMKESMSNNSIIKVPYTGLIAIKAKTENSSTTLMKFVLNK